MTLHNSPSQRAREQFLYPKAANPQDAPSKTALKVQKLLTPRQPRTQKSPNDLAGPISRVVVT
ncbi:hypothetical protein D9R19_11645 [Corynebacterium diphtheriae]|nr:hypothetical protein D9B36_11610 [Corynebacterium diphtheriae]RLP05988.1 hypothetical protein D9R17_12240 [Corynebacterium diphtheriae]RLP13841.1 hypothetical protein D9R19_11645 [Corynebacterium diphtheriae]